MKETGSFLLFKKKQMFLILCGIFLVIYLIFANQIFFTFFRGPGEFKLQKIKKEQIPVSHGFIESNLDSIGQRGNSMSNLVDCYGWGIDLAGKYSKIKEIKLIFSSEQINYIVDCAIEYRADVLTATGFEKTMLRDDNVGFRSAFSSANIQDGDYRLGLWIIGDNGQDGFVWMKTEGYGFRNGSILITPPHGLPSNVNLDDLHIEEQVDFGLYREESQNDDLYYRFAGWATLLGYPSDNQKVYLQFTSLETGLSFFYSTVSYGIPMYGKTLGSDIYINSAFFCQLPKNALPEKRYLVTPVIETMQEKEKMYYLSSKENLIHVKENSLEYQLENTQDFLYAIDSYDYNPETQWINIIGWAYKPNTDSVEQDILIELTLQDGSIKMLRTAKQRREALAQVYGIEALYAGYLISMHFPIEHKIQSFRLVHETDGQMSYVSPPLKYDGQPILSN